ncbi:unnamed protein product [Adineta ricciae]|uniref:Rab-GAP TBC domain-containing protein n=1 Tax=Adineta ricciae TaxID=249248 RepID=A0A815W1A7_ADIRI|nr:unnamed protein product [Adineta ricciae]
MTQSSSEQLPVVNMTNDDIELLKRLEEENRRIEYDTKSPANSTQTNHTGHPKSPELHHKQLRQDSISSDVSNLTIDADGNLESEWSAWNKIINNWTTYIKKKPQWIKDMIRAGVPIHFRPLLWQCLCKVETSHVKGKYAEYMKMISPCEKVIRRDISRTYPDHEFFKEKHGIGQERLFNVIKAYSLYDREVGYCQGIGFIVGLLLMHMPEEDAFAVLVSMMQDLSMRDMYKPDMFYLGLCIFQFEAMIQEFLPDLYRHFQVENFSTSTYASSWFLTLFTNQFSFNVACRTMDLFLSEGIEIIFRMGIALLEIHQDHLMLLSMDDMLKYFQKDVPIQHETDHESLFQRAFSVQYNSKKMKKLEKEYSVIRKEEQEEQIEVRRLRNENRLLKQRVENLEKESATLANRLIEGQVSNAQYAEESYQLKRENCTLKKQLDEKLKNATFSSSGHNSVQLTSPTELEMLRETVEKLNMENRNLQSMPHVEIAALQEELTLVKMRDAEAQVSMNELRQRIADLNREWQLHDSTCKTLRESNQVNESNDAYDLIAHELLSLKMREAQTDCDNKALSQQIMDLETQKQVVYNQIKRQDDEIQRMRLELDESRVREQELRAQLNETKNQMHDGELRLKEDSMMLRIREAESTQAIGDLRQRIAELEVQNQELITRGQIMDNRDLHDKLLELQDEVMRLRLLPTIHRNHSTSTDPHRHDYEESEDECLISPLSTSVNQRLSSSSIVLSPSSFISPNHRLRQSTPSLFPTLASSQSSATSTG